MPTSSTVIAALKFQDGVIIAGDSQASDPVAGVRWPTGKLFRPNPSFPLVIGFSGSVGRAQRAVGELQETKLHQNQFKNRGTIQKVIDNCLSPVFQEIREKADPRRNDLWNMTLWGLGAVWAGDQPHIIELEFNTDSSFHDFFHAIGSGAQTAYAVFRTLGGRNLVGLDEPRAIMAMLRILRTAVDVDMSGVSPPFAAWVITASKVRSIGQDELLPNNQLIDQWEAEERRYLFGGTDPGTESA